MITLKEVHDQIRRRLSRSFDDYYDDNLYNYHQGMRSFGYPIYAKIDYSRYKRGHMDDVAGSDAAISFLLNKNRNAKKE